MTPAAAVGRKVLGGLRRSRRDQPPGVVGVARIDRRTKSLIRRLRPGDIAVIDHADLDRIAAEALVNAGVAGVVNASPSISGRYPNLGPVVLLAAGVPLLDQVGRQVFAQLRDGESIRICDEDLVDRHGELVARGVRHDGETVREAMAAAQAGLAVQLEAFAANTAEHLRRERDLLLEGVGIPTIRTDLDGRPALVVMANYACRDDLTALRHFIRDHRPAVIGVDEGADVLLEAGLCPDLIVGDLELVSEAALRGGAELIVHADRDGRAPGLARVQELGIEPVIFAAAGTSEDVAMLLADSHGPH